MSIKILTKTGEEVTHIDDARAYNFDAGNRSGIVKGAYNEGRFFSASNNVIALDSCELRIAGHRVVIDSAESITLTNTPANNIRYSMIAEIVVNDSSTPNFRLFIQPSTTSLTKDNLYKTTKGSGTYQLEIGKFTLTSSGLIEDVVRTADLITGGIGDDDTGGVINIGNVTTNTLDAGMEAEVDIENRYSEEEKKTYTDFTFSIPKGEKGDKGDKGDKGEKGDKGDKGNTGVTPVITATATTLSAGSSATVTKSGTAENPTLAFGIPKGDKGDKGEKGDKGDEGDSGEIYQTTGTSTTGSMSQNATTTELAKKFNSGYGTCSTAGATSAKVVTISDTSWKLKVGTIIGVYFINRNTASNVTLNVNNTGAKNIFYSNANYTGNDRWITGETKSVIYYMYTGTVWVWISNSANKNTDTMPAISNTASGTAAKTANCSGYSKLAKSYLQVIIVNANSASSKLTLSVNGKTQGDIYINGKVSSATNYTLPAGSYFVYYDGTNYYFNTDGTITGQQKAYDVIYDMNSTDASINRGYTSGIQGGNGIDVDLSKYKYVEVTFQEWLRANVNPRLSTGFSQMAKLDLTQVVSDQSVGYFTNRGMTPEGKADTDTATIGIYYRHSTQYLSFDFMLNDGFRNNDPLYVVRKVIGVY